jgi:hypothetical protein
MKITFKRRRWTTIWTAFGTAQMRSFGRDYDIETKSVVQVKERSDGTHKIRAFALKITGEHLADLDWEYVLKTMGDAKLRQAILDHNIT